MMKKCVALSLCISLLSSYAYASRPILQEFTPIGIGTLIGLYGLRLMHKSTKKKGTPTQLVAGAATTLGGAYIATHGPKYIRHKESSFWNWIPDAEYQFKKSNALDKYENLKNRANDSLTKVLCRIYITALKYDPFEMIPVE